jgi:hydrogenase maturation protein HypF
MGRPRATAGAAAVSAAARAPAAGARRRVRARVDGTVQGVGFRPYVFRLAEEEALGGFVANDERGVVLEVEGPEEAVERFLRRLPSEAPALATVEAVRSEPVSATGGSGFRILDSARGGVPAAHVTPDSATCDACLAELFTPGDRRHRYPFINCTDCGPRFTIVRGVPYDRPLTTMAGFVMCDACRAEYDDPRDRRFHAQPNACPSCGPQVSLVDAGGAAVAAADPVRAAAAALREGRILAVKGLGGFHLACRCDDEGAVAALRARKHREDRPFALMAPDVSVVSALVDLGQADEALLCGRERPIAIARRRRGGRVAPSVAPRSAELGVMLPYTPLHHLLLADAGVPLVMTSGNVADEPIAYSDADALRRLAGIADLLLLHDRPIHVRADDSVVRSVPGRAPLLVRRSRGHVPASLRLPEPAARPVLACGAELKSTFCVAKGDRAWVGHHIGDLKLEETLRAFEDGIAHFERLFAVTPEVVAHDEHPDYLSTSYALARAGVRHVAVQHHWAHLAACLAEHGETGPAVGAIYDGSGHGSDGAVWGGELLVGGLDGFRRAGHLCEVRLPGGDQAVRQPWRMACAWLVAATGEAEPPRPTALRDAVDEARWRAVAGMAARGVMAPRTTSAGRLFDAVAALCGLRPTVTYEGQAAVELEAALDRHARGAYPIAVAADGVLDAREAVVAVARDVAAGLPAGVVSARFHRGLADATARACAEIAAREGVGVAVLSGGVFQNVALLTATRDRLEAAGLRVLVPERLPPNDGGVSFGQAAVAAAMRG